MNTQIEEYFDIVDENDQPLGIAKPRSQVHAELTDWHRVTSIVIINDHQQFLCQQRSKEKDVNPGMWQYWFGGHVKAGEEYQENAINEVQEEIGLVIPSAQLMYLGKTRNLQHKHHVGVFIYHWSGSIDEITFNDGEVEQVKQLSWEDYIKMQKELLPDKEIKMNELVEKYIQTN